MRSATPLLLVMLAACAAKPVTPTSVDPPYEVVSTERQVDVAEEASSIRIDNPHGDVRVRIVDGQKMGVYATIQRIGETPLDPSIAIDGGGAQATITVRYPSEGPGRVDLAVFVPEKLAIDLVTTSGLAQVRRAKRDVRARTTSGKIEVTGFASLDLVTQTGDIVMRQTTGVFDSVNVETPTGKVYATVPAFADIILDVAAQRIEPQQGLPIPVTNAEGMAMNARFGQALRTVRIRGIDVYLTPEIRLP